MIGFSLMMWFISIILMILSISLLRGNTSSMHGKVYNTTKDRIGYGKAFGKVTLFLSIGIMICGIVALLGDSVTGLRNSLLILIFIIIVTVICSIKIQKKFGALH